jgi:hypothetical protein
MLELYNTELKIYEIGYSQAPFSFKNPSNRRLECLYACLNAAKSWGDTFLSIPPAQYIGFPASIYSSMACCFIGIYRLSTFDHSEWDLGLVRETFDVSLFLEKVENVLTGVTQAAGLDSHGEEDKDFFIGMASRIRTIRLSWNALTNFKMAALDIVPGDEMFGFSIDPLDDEWMRDLLVSWNE